MEERIKLSTKSTGQKERIIILILVNLAISGAGILLHLLVAANTIRIANKPVPSQVQLSSGEAIATKAVDKNHREEIVITNFVNKVLTALYTANGYIPPKTPEEGSKPITDPGVVIKGKSGKGKRITTSAYEASFALNPQIRKDFLENMVEVIPQTIFSQGKQLIFVPSHISPPIPIKGKPGRWKVNVVANLYVFQNGKSLNKAIAFNKEVYLKAVDPPKFDKEVSSSITRLIEDYRQAGLEISEMRELSLD